MLAFIFSAILIVSNYFQIQEADNEVIVQCINGHYCNDKYPWALIENGKESKPKYIDTYQAAFRKPKSNRYKVKLGTCDQYMCQSLTVEINMK